MKSSYSSRARTLKLTATCLFALTASFYALQHSAFGVGGAVAPVKALWLLAVVTFWFVLPVLWLVSSALDTRARLACGLFLCSMVARAGVELVMMYGTDNWRHAYGIAHDLFSVLLCVSFAIMLIAETRWLAAYFVWCAFLFLLETGFAAYLRQVSNTDGSVFFLPSDPAHGTVLMVTWLGVMSSGVVITLLLRGWLRASPAY